MNYPNSYLRNLANDRPPRSVHSTHSTVYKVYDEGGKIEIFTKEFISDASLEVSGHKFTLSLINDTVWNKSQLKEDLSVQLDNVVGFSTFLEYQLGPKTKLGSVFYHMDLMWKPYCR